MDFKKATDELFRPISHEEVAKALDCSVATLRQARLSESANAHRSPPGNWEAKVAKVAYVRADQLRRLADRLKPRNFEAK